MTQVWHHQRGHKIWNQFIFHHTLQPQRISDYILPRIFIIAPTSTLYIIISITTVEHLPPLKTPVTRMNHSINLPVILIYTLSLQYLRISNKYYVDGGPVNNTTQSPNNCYVLPNIPSADELGYCYLSMVYMEDLKILMETFVTKCCYYLWLHWYSSVRSILWKK